MAPVAAAHRRSQRRLTHGVWQVECTCGWVHWTRHRHHGLGVFRDHVHRVIKQAKRKAA